MNSSDYNRLDSQKHAMLKGNPGVAWLTLFPPEPGVESKSTRQLQEGRRGTNTSPWIRALALLLSYSSHLGLSLSPGHTKEKV